VAVAVLVEVAGIVEVDVDVRVAVDGGV